MNSQELVTLYRKLRDGRETRETMPRWLAELVIGNIPLPFEAGGEPQTAKARIEPIAPVVINPSASYPIKASTPEHTKEVALNLASFATARLVA